MTFFLAFNSFNPITKKLIKIKSLCSLLCLFSQHLNFLLQLRYLRCSRSHWRL